MKRMTAWLHRQSVQRKLLIVILVSCSASMLVAGAALFMFMTLSLRSNFVNDTRALAEIAAANSVGAAAFKDKEAAQEVINSLTTQPHIVGTCIRLADGQLLAGAGKTIYPPFESVTNKQNGKWLHDTLYEHSSPIIASGETIGILCLTTDFTEIHDRLLRSYVLVFAIVMASALLVGIPLSMGARRVISDPLRSLADSVKAASSRPDAAQGSGTRHSSELEEIADAFTVMKERVEAGAKLEREIAERRKAEQALRKSEEQFRSLFENAPVGLYRSGREGRFLMANPALLRMLGYEHFEELAELDIHTDLCAGKEYRTQFSECLERFGMVEETEVQWRRRDGNLIFVRESAKAIRNGKGEIVYCEGCVEDITARKEAQAELQRLHRELVEASRAAGMAEVATGVLHNVGNVLNSVNVSATVVSDQLGRSKMASLQQAVALLETHLPDLQTFLETDPKGKLLPDFLIKVSQHVAGEHARWREELLEMRKNIEHMKVIVSMQQNYAKVTGALETLSAVDLAEDALRMNEMALKRHEVQIDRVFGDVPPVLADKHKVLQILVNLIQNAKYALHESPLPQKQLQVRISKNGSGKVKIQVTDNGIGISPDNLTRVFSHGFTTRRNGHGFGLHSGALAAREIGGSLEAHSEGLGHGATFTLELPIAGTNNG